MGTDTRTPTPPIQPLTPGEESSLPERWGAQRKMELVLRLLLGEPLVVSEAEWHLADRQSGE